MSQHISYVLFCPIIWGQANLIPAQFGMDIARGKVTHMHPG